VPRVKGTHDFKRDPDIDVSLHEHFFMVMIIDSRNPQPTLPVRN
jgi:hypothetical protein